MNFSRKTKLFTLLLITILLISACAADNKAIMRDIENIGNAFKDMGNQAVGITPEETTIETEATTESSEVPASTVEDVSVVEETEVTEAIVVVETVADPAPTAKPTPTATPTPEPTPEVKSRVDFSELTEIDITELFTVEQETFEENYGTEDESFVSFSGERLLVSMPENKIPAASINLLLNSFYKEAEGLYYSYSDEAEAEYILNEMVEVPVSIEVHYSYANNDRVLAVKMEYSLTVGEDTVTKTEVEMFDMLTASRITNYDITDDVNALEATLFAKYADLKLKKYDSIMLVPDSEDELVIWMFSDGEFYKEHISTDELSNILNRYGNLIYSLG